jgi:hypothetical protein
VVGPVLEAVVLGWVLGGAVGTLVVRRRERQGRPVDRDELIERWQIFLAVGAATIALAGRIF